MAVANVSASTEVSARYPNVVIFDPVTLLLVVAVAPILVQFVPVVRLLKKVSFFQKTVYLGAAKYPRAVFPPVPVVIE